MKKKEVIKNELRKYMNQEFIKLTESIQLDYVIVLNKLYKLVDNH